MGLQTTIGSPVRFIHKGLLTGKTCSVRLKPGLANSGIVFNGRLPAFIGNAFVEQHSVGLRKGRQTVLGVEHLLAACYGLGVDNLQVEVTGGEVPFGDGSALPFVRILRAAGIRTLAARQQTQRLIRPVVLHQEDAFLCAMPLPRETNSNRAMTINCFIRFPEPEVGEQFLAGELSGSFFTQEVASARTFGYRRQGWNLPSWLARTVREKGNLFVPAKPRFVNEQVRHKTLDLLGDLCLLGRRLQAGIFAWRSGHSLHHAVLKELEELWT